MVQPSDTVHGSSFLQFPKIYLLDCMGMRERKEKCGYHIFQWTLQWLLFTYSWPWENMTISFMNLLVEKFEYCFCQQCHQAGFLKMRKCSPLICQLLMMTFLQNLNKARLTRYYTSSSNFHHVATFKYPALLAQTFSTRFNHLPAQQVQQEIAIGRLATSYIFIEQNTNV